jgi:PKD repeat protein
MKNIIFTLLTGLFLSLSATAQDYTITVFGSVMKVSANQVIPVPDQQVIITIDSSANGFYYQNSVYTDDSGYYQDIISITGQPGYLRVQTMTYDSCLIQYLYDSQYVVPGTTLTSMDFYLCNATSPECQALFYYYQSDPADPYTYTFYNQSVGNYTQVTWYFGDSTYSSEVNPVHTFPGPGTYTVCLTISDGADCNSTYCDLLTAGGSGYGCENYFTYTYATPFALTFEGFLYNGQTAQYYLWNFGDGTTGEGQNITHTFPEGQGNNGAYMVSLTTMILDSLGIDTCFYTSYQEISIYNQYQCNAYFTYYPDSTDQLTIQFQDMSYDANGVPPDSWFWSFGDSTTSTLQNPLHTYADTGYYMVCLTIADSMGLCSDTYCEEIFTGYTPPPSECSAYFSHEQVDSLTLTFTGIIYINNGQTYPDSTSVFTWDFGDGTTGMGQTITHAFPDDPAGGYMVCLLTSIVLPDGNSCTATYCETISLNIPTFSIYGYVILDNQQFADQGIAHLMIMDSLQQNVIEVQSATLDTMGQYYFPDIAIYNVWIYYVQAELTEGSAWFGQYLPTYHLNSLSWEEAQPVYPVPNEPANIYMIAGTPADGGNGVITGLVTNLGAREFMSGVEVVLLDAAGNPLTYMRSDEQGSFTFENLPYGTYIIHAELAGIHTTEAGITLSAEQPSANVQVQVSGGEANVVFGVPEHNIYLDKAGDVYPNPVNSTAKIDITVKKPVSAEISIFGQTGQLMNANGSLLSAGTHTLTLDTGSFPAGLYLLRISTGQGEMICRKFMIAR